MAFLDEAFGSLPREAWVKALRNHSGDFIFTIVNSVDDLPDDPQMRINGYLADLDHPQFGPTTMVGLPVELKETPGSLRDPAPELGQHTEQILLDLLGWDWDRIQELREKEVI